MSDGNTDAHQSAATPEPPPQPEPAPPPEPSPRIEPAPPRRARRLALWIAGVVILVLAAGGAWWAWQNLPMRIGAPFTERLAAMDARELKDAQRIAALESELQQVRSASDGAASVATVNALGARVAAIEQKGALSATDASDIAALKSTLTSLAARLDADEARLQALTAEAARQQQGSGRMLMVALDELRAALSGSGPYAAALSAVAALSHDNHAIAKALQPLAADATTGIPSTALLARRFDSTTAAAIFRATAAAPPAQDTSLGARILAHLSKLVVIHRVAGDPTANAVAAARRALDAGDLAGAVRVLQGLKGPAGAAAAPWVSVAERRLADEAALDRVSEEVAAHLAAAPAGAAH